MNDLEYSLGLDVSPMQKAGATVAKFGDDTVRVLNKKFSGADLFRGILQGVGIASVGQIAEKLIAPFRESAESAQRIAEYTDRAASATERLIALRQTDLQQLATMEKQYARLAEESGKAADISTWEKIKALAIGGPLLGMKMVRDKQAEANAEKQAKSAADLTAKALEIETKKQAIARQSDAEAMKAYQEQYAQEEKRSVAVKNLAAFEREQRMDRMTDEQKVGALQKERTGVIKEIAEFEKFIREGGQLTNLGLEELLTLKKEQRDVEEEIVKLTETKRGTEERVNELMLRQLEAQAEMEGKQRLLLTDTLIVNGKSYGASRSPETFERSTSASLQELIRRLQDEIKSIEASKGSGLTALADAATGYLIQNSVIARLQTDIIRAEYQLSERERIMRDRDLLGEASARRNFAGDPLEFDAASARARGLSDNEKTVKALDELRLKQERGLQSIAESLKALR